ncbi:MAG: hypothetical protein IJZ42_04265 [Lachnospiraceae bacterium]|nr:hypothetical protein [Lachnospiraceae bacterium]
MQNERKVDISNKWRREFFCILLIMLIGIVVRTIFATFSKTLETYPDELRYYELARSIYQNNGLTIRNAATDFQKIAYTLFLVPFFAIEDTVSRINVLGVFNAFIMSSSIIPMWLIIKEIDLKGKIRYFVLILMMIWPDMIYSATVMSEVLYYPLMLWFIYVWILNEKKKKIVFAIAEGVLCYFGYLCKEVFLAMLVACVAYEIIYPIVEFIISKRKVEYKKENVIRKKLLGIVAFVFSFAVCYAVMKLLVFNGLGNSYNQMGISAILVSYNFIYLIYGFFYYIAAIFMVTLFFPIIYPIVNYAKLEDMSRKLFCFIGVFVVILSATVAYTITVREDLGCMVPRVHLRYVGPVIIVLFAILFKYLQNKPQEEISLYKKETGGLLVISFIFVAAIFKGTASGSAVDQFTLGWYRFLQEEIGTLFLEKVSSMEIYLYAVVINTILFLVIGTMHVICMFKSSKLMSYFFGILIVLICFSNNAVGLKRVYDAYYVNPNIVEEVVDINEYFETVSDEVRIIYFTNADYINKESKVFDTYFDNMDNLYIVDDIYYTVSEGSVDVSNVQFYENIWGTNYDKVDGVDYFIIENGCNFNFLQLSEVEKVPSLSGDYFTVYRNLDPENIVATYECINIYFAGDDYNANRYNIIGVSGRENEFSWTEGKVLKVEIPLQGYVGTLDVTISVLGTFEGEQRYNVLQDGKIVSSGTLNGAGEISFSVNAKEDNLVFEIDMPDAKIISEVLGTSDHRQVAFQLQKLHAEPK